MPDSKPDILSTICTSGVVCIYKKDIIGDERFNPIYKMAEDYDFNQRVRKGNKSNIVDILYFYNENTPNSLTKQGALYNNKYKED